MLKSFLVFTVWATYYAWSSSNVVYPRAVSEPSALDGSIWFDSTSLTQVGPPPLNEGSQAFMLNSWKYLSWVEFEGALTSYLASWPEFASLLQVVSNLTHFICVSYTNVLVVFLLPLWPATTHHRYPFITKLIWFTNRKPFLWARNNGERVKRWWGAAFTHVLTYQCPTILIYSCAAANVAISVVVGGCNSCC